MDSAKTKKKQGIKHGAVAAKSTAARDKQSKKAESPSKSPARSAKSSATSAKSSARSPAKAPSTSKSPAKKTALAEPSPLEIKEAATKGRKRAAKAPAKAEDQAKGNKKSEAVETSKTNKRKSTMAAAKKVKSEESEVGGASSNASANAPGNGGQLSVKAHSEHLNETLPALYAGDPPKQSHKFSMKIISWNINGLKSFLQKADAVAYLKQSGADVIGLQEIKCDAKTIPAAARTLLPGYSAYFSSAAKAGYAGTALYCKQAPINVTYGLGEQKHDEEGRLITAEFEKCFVVTSYVPNSGRGLTRLDYRTKEWDLALLAYLKRLDASKPLVLCGDLNVAHLAADLANPKGNERTSGFSPAEREGFTQLLAAGFVDSFRALHPKATGQYSFWSTMHNARASNTGWRLDYFVVSKRIAEAGALHDSIIDDKVLGSDHAPIVLTLELAVL